MVARKHSKRASRIVEEIMVRLGMAALGAGGRTDSRVPINSISLVVKGTHPHVS